MICYESYIESSVIYYIWNKNMKEQVNYIEKIKQLLI